MVLAMCCAMAASWYSILCIWGVLYFFFVFLYFIIVIVKMQYKRFECSSVVESATEEPVHILEGCGHNFVGLQVARSVMS